MKKAKKELVLYPLHIPVKPHVKQFLNFHCGPDYTLSFSSYLGPQIFSVFANKFKKKEVVIDPKEYSEKYTILLGAKYFFERGINKFTDYQVLIFNRMIIEQFNDRMVDYVATMESLGINNKTSILEWGERYQLDAGSADWYQWLKKEYYRKRNNYLKNIKKAPTDLSPAFRKQKHTLAG